MRKVETYCDVPGEIKIALLQVRKYFCASFKEIVCPLE